MDNDRKVGWVGEGRARRRVDNRRPDVPVPFEILLDRLCERYGGWPWELERQPAEDVLRYLAILGRKAHWEGEVAELEPGDVMFWDE